MFRDIYKHYFSVYIIYIYIHFNLGGLKYIYILYIYIVIFYYIRVAKPLYNDKMLLLCISHDAKHVEYKTI